MSEDILELTPGTDQDIANLFLQRLEQAVNNKAISGLLVTDKEGAALLRWINNLEAEIISFRETYQGGRP